MRKIDVFKKITAIFLSFLFAQISQADEKIVVFAAASLTNALTEISDKYEKESGVKIVHSFAASSTLAKQIENGAPADIFISADIKWMTYLQDKMLINQGSRKNLLGNELVLIAPKGKVFQTKFEKNFKFANAFNGRLCTGNVESVPVGIYAKEALMNLGWWNDIKSRVVGAEDVRSALMFVERGECNAGIVYETDANISTKSELIGVFPEQSHSPILYPVATTNTKNATVLYLTYLQSPAALGIFRKYGFNTNLKD